MELCRALRRGAAAADTGDAGLPISGFLVELAAGRATFGNSRPGFLRAGDLCNETPLGVRYLACLPCFALRHAETAGQFRRRTWVVHWLCIYLGRGKTEYGQNGEKERRHQKLDHHYARHASTVSCLAATGGSA